jgi:soluble lytic murein transglycosylase
MQLLPSTAEITAKKEGLKYSRTALLDDPEYNMTLGAAHLSHLLARYSQSQIMTFAAYNAGPNRVTQWVEKFGDPRSGAVDPVDWIELIPFQETRNYVQRVLENTQIYRGRLSEAPIAGRLSADIERGGSSKRAGLLPARQYAGTLPPLPERTRKMASDAKVEESAAPEEGAPSGAASAPAEISALAPAEHTLTAADEADFIGDAPKKLAASKKGPRPRLEPRQEPREPVPNVQPPASEKPADKTTGDQAASAPAGRPASKIVLPAAGSADADHIVAAPTTTKTPSPPAAQDPSSAPLKMSPVYAPDEAPAPPPSTAMPSAVEQPSSPGASAAADPCMTYRDFVAKSGKAEASAADLNAGMLAEATSGGAACGETKTP